MRRQRADERGGRGRRAAGLSEPRTTGPSTAYTGSSTDRCLLLCRLLLLCIGFGIMVDRLLV